MDYLVYVEHSAENLQFYLWYQDYERRWNTISAGQRALSPEVQPDTADFPNLTNERSMNIGERIASARPKVLSESAGWSAKGMTFFLDDGVESDDAGSIAMAPTSVNSTIPSDADIAAQAGLKWQPCMTLPLYSPLLS